MIVDSQVHIWAADTPERPWRGGRAAENVHLPRPFGYEDLRREMDALGIDRAILVPPGWEGDRVDFALEGAAKYPDRFAVMGRIPVELPQSREMLPGWLDQPGMLGVRLAFQHELNRHFMGDGTVDWFWPEAERLAIPIMLFAPHWLSRIGEIAGRHPRLKIIIDHFGLYRQKDAEAAAAIAETAKLARHPNIYVKVSSAPLYSSEDYPYNDLHAPLRNLIFAFGPERCFWGSDVTRLMNRRKGSYSECLLMFTEALDFLTPSDRDWILGRAILQCLGWKALA